jgi:ribosomal protein S18 acetylase RimI-like enzyme
VIDLRDADAAEISAATRERTDRFRAWYERFGASPGWTDKQVTGQISGNTKVPMKTYALLGDGENVGFLVAGLAPEAGRRAVINDIWIDPAYRRRGFATEARRWAEKNAQSKALFVNTDPEDEASAALFASYPVRAQTMIKRLVTPDPLPAGVVGRPMTEAEFVGWTDESIRGYAADMADSGTLSPEEAMERSKTQFAEILPDGLQSADQTFWTIDADGTPVATNWLAHHYGPELSFVYSVEAHEEFRGKGYGKAAMIVGEQASLDAGDTHLALNVFGHNDVAINLYTRMGYRLADQARSVDL